MITKLSIQNFALIDDISVELSSGLTTITGETGAGKSILLGALALVLGKRADLTSVRDVSKKCIIEAEFTLDEKYFSNYFNRYDLDFEAHTIIRRELLPSGKSRAFVNDTPVTLTQLQNIATHLIDIHGQHETLDLFSEFYQMEIIDILAGNKVLLEKYSEKLKEYNSLSETISDLYYKKETASKEMDYNTFLYQELIEANLEDKNQKELEESYEKLNNTETIQESLSQINQLFSEEQIGSLTTLKEASHLLSKLQNISSEFNEIWNRVNSVSIEMEDISNELESIFSSIESNPLLLSEINEQLQLLYKLQQKHSVATLPELLEIQNKLASKIEITQNLDGEILKLEELQTKVKKTVSDIGSKLHKKRLNSVAPLKNKLTAILNQLGLPNADFEFKLIPTSNFRKNGMDSLQLLFTANKGQEFAPLKKVASGGELSRIMLSIKAVLAQYKQLPTAIFDEIDSGISGEIAYKMAIILKEMSLTMQMLSITHLPQIAAAGNQQIKIYKEDFDNVTVTKLKTLSDSEREKEIAEMIGGKNKSASAITQAKELLN